MGNIGSRLRNRRERELSARRSGIATVVSLGEPEELQRWELQPFMGLAGPENSMDPGYEDRANPRVIGTFTEAGGELFMEEYGVRMLIPAGAIETGSQLISLELLSTTPRINLSIDEMVVCWAFRCEPSHLEFKESITIEMPHCAEMTIPDDVHTAFYSWSEYQDGHPYGMTRIEGHQEDGDKDVPTCIVRKGYLELRINHFSWNLLSLIWNSIPSWRAIRKRVLITPYMPRAMPQSRVLHLRIHVYDDVEGHDKKILSEERDSGYNIVHPSTDLNLDPGIDVAVRCEDRTSQSVHDKAIPSVGIFHTCRCTVSFELDFKNQEANQKFLTLSIGQENMTKTMEIITFNGEPEPERNESSSLRDDLLLKIAKEISATKFVHLGIRMGCTANELDQILDSRHHNYLTATMEVMNRWKETKGRNANLESLRSILDQAGLSDLALRHLSNPQPVGAEAAADPGMGNP